MYKRQAQSSSRGRICLNYRTFLPTPAVSEEESKGVQGVMTEPRTRRGARTALSTRGETYDWGAATPAPLEQPGLGMGKDRGCNVCLSDRAIT